MPNACAKRNNNICKKKKTQILPNFWYHANVKLTLFGINNQDPSKVLRTFELTCGYANQSLLKWLKIHIFFKLVFYNIHFNSIIYKPLLTLMLTSISWVASYIHFSMFLRPFKISYLLSLRLPLHFFMLCSRDLCNFTF